MLCKLLGHRGSGNKGVCFGDAKNGNDCLSGQYDFAVASLRTYVTCSLEGREPSIRSYSEVDYVRVSSSVIGRGGWESSMMLSENSTEFAVIAELMQRNLHVASPAIRYCRSSNCI